MKNESKDQISDVRSARDAKQRENRLLWVVSLLGLPFIVLAHSPTTVKIMQAYLLTAIVFGGLIFLPKRPEIKKWWFWKAIATGFLVHIAIVTGVFYWDNLNPQVAAKTFRLFGVLWVACMVDLFVVLVIIEIFRPEDELEDT